MLHARNAKGALCLPAGAAVHHRSFAEVQHLPAFSPLLPGLAGALEREIAANEAAAMKPCAVAGSPAYSDLSNADVSLSTSCSSSPFDEEQPEALQGPREVEAAFESPGLAAVSAHDYLVRLCKYACCSQAIFVKVWIYIDRLRAATGMRLTSSNVHRVIMAAFVVAVKLHDDVFYSNSYYAGIGGMTLEAINAAETALLAGLNWDTHVAPKQYVGYMRAALFGDK